jgi:isoleucyl-tRNA synthetase
MQKSPFKSEAEIDLHRPFVDDIILVSPTGKPMHRETDLIDVWFDSGAMPYAQNHYPFSPLTPEGGTVPSYPADFISEGVDQTRGWFFTLHAIAGMLFDSVAFKNVVSTGLVLDKNGEKMSKRKGNVVEPLTVTKKAVIVLGKNEKGEAITEETKEPYEIEGALSKYGADATRWYMISNSNPWDNLKFSWEPRIDHEQKKIYAQSEGIEEVQRKLFGTLRNTYNFFALYANLDNFTFSEAEINLAERTESDRWIISRLNTLVKEVSLALDDYEPTKATRAVMDFVNDDLSNWYVRLNRKRFWKTSPLNLPPTPSILEGASNSPLQNREGAGDEVSKLSAYQTLYTCLETVAKLMAPIAPFYAERLFLDLNNATKRDKNVSVHLSLFPTVQASAIDADLEQKMQLAQSISSLTHSIRKKLTIRVRQPLSKIILPITDKKTIEQVSHVADIIKDEVNVKTIEFMTDDSAIVSKTVKPNFKTLGAKYKQQMKEVQNAVQLLEREDISTLERGGSVGKGGFELVLEDVLITSQDIEGLSTATDGTITVALDVTITPELRKEGIARDFVNRTQNYRKDSNFEVQDKIKVWVSNQYAEVVEALQAFTEYICTETQALELTFDAKVEGQVFEIEEFAFEVRIEKV